MSCGRQIRIGLHAAGRLRLFVQGYDRAAMADFFIRASPDGRRADHLRSVIDV
jgi:hypothetical protein